MKKGLKWNALLLLALSFALVLAACGNKASTDTTAGEAGGEAQSALEAIKARGKLVVGVKSDTKLFGLKNTSTGDIEGFDVDVAKAIAKHILGDETKIELKEVTSKTRIPLLQNGEIDMIVATMTITEERKQQVDFSDVYFEAGQSLLVPKGSPITGVDSLTKGTKVLAVKGSTSVKNIREKAPDAEVLEFENYQDAFNALKANKGDALTTDNAILFGMQQQDASFEMVGGNFTDEPYGIAVKKGSTDLLQAVNDTLTDLKSSGDYDKLYEQWLGVKPE
ncbi:transporter substrate-binding domain-containing protein [Paenibacillus sp. P96]|uniref:Transporter substrate-binding domain-containing protein n=1 Tax=Paenibacillus zeirhizosphaerae TaxID=2987519 RepID=A0ABT9FMT2_9BACL|nr:transporter substrate-binding domain-containing protein [Paenibacillus sp. P96]MDP4096049.1 transporter substrate-binding domain-containing protein [Paenibacillus sp. P96]